MTQFKCPFEVKWNNEDSIIHTQVESENELSKITDWVNKFLSDTSASALKIILPNELNFLKGWNEELHSLLLPYVAESTAATIEHQLYPFFPHQINDFIKENSDLSNEEIAEKYEEICMNNWELGLVYSTIQSNITQLLSTDISTQSLRTYLNQKFTQALKQSNKNSQIVLCDNTLLWALPPKDRAVLVANYSWDVAFPVFKHSQKYQESWTIYDKDTFAFTTTPYYPENIGRYSDKTTLVVTKYKDIGKVSREQRKKIRDTANAEYVKAGMMTYEEAKDFETPNWLWLPDSKK